MEPLLQERDQLIFRELRRNHTAAETALSPLVSDLKQLPCNSSPHGFNLGMNQGSVAGAGIAAHLHQHVVPRWGGDQNFMPIIGRTRTMPQLMADTRKLLAEAWPA